MNQSPHLAISFTFKYAEFKCLGYSPAQSLAIAGEHFKREISAVAIRKCKGKEDSKRYYFNDDTYFIFENGYFKLYSLNKQKQDRD